MTSTLRCLQVLRMLSEEPYELSVTDVARGLQVAKASAHRLLITLQDGGFVKQNPLTLRYHVSGGALWVGTSFLRGSALFRTAMPHLQDLSRQIETTVHLAIRDEDAVMFLYPVGYPSTTHMFASVGDRRPLHATAIGKVLLSELPESEISRILQETGTKWTEHTIVTLEAMLPELALTRQRGYAFSNQEWLKGYCALAAPLRGPGAVIQAAVNISGPCRQFQEKQKDRYVRPLLDTCLRISLQLGYRLDGRRPHHAV